MPTPTIVWAVDADGNWSTTVDWSPARAPNSTDNVSINTADLHTVAHSAGTDTVHTLAVGNDDFTVSGGSLTVLFSASFANLLTVSGGTLTIDGPASFGSKVVGAGTVSVSGATAISGLTLDGGLTFNNRGTATAAGDLTLNLTTFNNKTGAAYDITGDNGIATGVAGGQLFVNAGTFAKTGGGGASIVAVNFTSTGAVNVASGALQFDGANNYFGGTVSGAGTLDLNTGANVLGSGLVLSVASLTIDGPGVKVTLDGNLAYAGVYTQITGTLDVGSHDLTLSGSTNFPVEEIPEINGSGSVTTTGVTAINELILSGGLRFNNSGTASIYGEVDLAGATLDNEAGGVCNLFGGAEIGLGGAALFVNAGILNLVDSGIASFGEDLMSTGIIGIAVGGTLEFVNRSTNSFAGSLSGPGTIKFSNSSNTFASGLSLTVANVEIVDGANMALGGTLTYGRNFLLQQATLNLGGYALNLSGPATFTALGQPILVTGGGALSTTGATAMKGLTVDGGVTFKNSGTVTATDVLTLANATFVNRTGAAYDLAGDVGVSLGSTGAPLFQNAGTFAKTGGSAVSRVAVNFTSTGTVSVAVGTLEFDGASNSLAGAVSGAGKLAFGGGASTLGSGLSLSVAAVNESGAATLVNVASASQAYAGVWTQAAGALFVPTGDRVVFTGTGNSFGGTIEGAGSVAFTGGSETLNGATLSAISLNINGAAVTLAGTIDNAGLVSAATPNLVVAAGGAFLTGGGAFNLTNLASNKISGATASATLTNVNDKIGGAGNLGGGQMTLVNDAGGLIRGNASVGLIIDTGANTITNAGIIESVSAGGATIKSAVANAGSLTVNAGTLTLDGAITGSGSVRIGGGVADIVTTSFSENVVFTASTGLLELANSQGYAGQVSGLSKTGTNSLDLTDIGFTSGVTKAGYSGTTASGTLTVTDGTHTAKITLLGNYLSSTFAVSGDGHGGTTVADPIAPPSPASARITGGPAPQIMETAMPTPTISWAVDADGDWSTMADWSTGQAPFSTDDVAINTADRHTITHSAGTDTVNSLTVGDDDFTVSGGCLTVLTSASFANRVTLSGGTLDFYSANASIATFNQSGGTLAGSATLIVTGAASLGSMNNTLELGPGRTVLKGVTTLAAGSFTFGLDGHRTLENRGTLNFTQGSIVLGFNPFGASLGHGTLKNDTGATIEVAAGTTIEGLYARTDVINAGKFEVTAPGGLSQIQLTTFTSTGTVNVASGTLEFNGVAASFAGVVSGGGSIDLAGGTSTLGPGLNLTVANLAIEYGHPGGGSPYGSALVTLGGDLAYAGNFAQSGGSLLLGGFSLTLAGQSNFQGATVIGGGSLVNSGRMSIRGLNLTGVSLINTGTVNPFGLLQFNTFENAAGAICEFTLGGGVSGASLVNAGKVETVGTGVSNIDANFTSSGSVSIAGGTLKFGGALNSFAGAVSGAGTMALGTGTTILGPSLVLTVAKVTQSGASTLVEVQTANLTYAGALTQTAGVLSVTGSDKITFTGAGNSFAGTLAGAGNVAFVGGSDTLSGTTVSAARLIINGGAVSLSGMITDTGVISVTGPNLTIAGGGATLTGGGSVNLTNLASNKISGATASATLTNANDLIQGAGDLGGGQMVLVNQTAGLIQGNASAGLIIDTGANTITNAGVIENVGTGETTIKSAVANSGSLAVNAGTLALDGAITGSGTVRIGGGVADIVTTSFGENVVFTGSTGVLELANSQGYAGQVSGLSKTGTNSLDLTDIGFSSGVTKASYNGTTASGTLTVTDGTHTSKITLLGNFTSSTFTVSSDGRGGTTVVDPAAGASGPAPLAQAMAGFQRGPPPHLAGTSAYSLPRFPIFHARA